MRNQNTDSRNLVIKNTNDHFHDLDYMSRDVLALLVSFSHPPTGVARPGRKSLPSPQKLHMKKVLENFPAQ